MIGSWRSFALAALFLVGLGTSASAADTLHVPADYATIQAAVDAADVSDTIRVASGNYGPFVIAGSPGLTVRGGPGVVVTGTAGPAVTVINGGFIFLRDLELRGGPGEPAVRSVHTGSVSVLSCVIVGGVQFAEGTLDGAVIDSDISGALAGISMVDPADDTQSPGTLRVRNCDITDVPVGISVQAGRSVRIERVHFDLIAFAGVSVLRAAAPDTTGDSVVVNRCTFAFVGQDELDEAIAIEVAGAPTVSITRTAIADVVGDGIRVGAAAWSTLIDRTRFERVTGTAVDLGDEAESFADDRFDVERCRFTDIGTGVLLRSRGHLTVERTSFENVQASAVRNDIGTRPFEDTRVTIRRCRVELTGSDAFHLQADDCLIDRTRITSVAGVAIRARGTDNAVTRVRMRDIADFGVLASGDGTRLERNALRDVIVGLYCLGNRQHVERNKVIDARFTAMQFAGSGPPSVEPEISRNLVRGGQDGLFLFLTGGLVERNKVFDVEKTGMLCQGTDTEYRRNKVLRSGRRGIDADGVGFTFAGNVATGSGRCDYREESLPDESVNTLSGNSFGVECWDD